MTLQLKKLNLTFYVIFILKQYRYVNDYHDYDFILQGSLKIPNHWYPVSKNTSTM
jgi:hypothetical protein